MNLVHYKAVRKQLVAVVLSIVNCMFYSCQLSAVLWRLPWVPLMFRVIGSMRVCPSPKEHLDQFSYYFTAYSCVHIITDWPTFGHFAAHLSLPGSKHKKQSDSTFPHSTCHSTNFLLSHSIGWLSIGNSIRPVKIEWWGVGVVICLELGADCLHVV